jgi:hypothetical protein
VRELTENPTFQAVRSQISDKPVSRPSGCAAEQGKRFVCHSLCLSHKQFQGANAQESERRFCQANLGRAACDFKADFAKRRLYKTFRNNALGHELREKVSRHSDLVQQQNMKKAGQRAS